jgi:hypothetical protein
MNQWNNFMKKKKGKMKRISRSRRERFRQVPPKTPRKRVQKNHPLDHIIGNKDAGVETRRRIHSPEQMHLTLLSTIEPNSFEEAIKAMNFYYSN